jgi:hypothetical protein
LGWPPKGICLVWFGSCPDAKCCQLCLEIASTKVRVRSFDALVAGAVAVLSLSLLSLPFMTVHLHMFRYFSRDVNEDNVIAVIVIIHLAVQNCLCL